MVVLGVIWMNQHGFPIFGIQNDLFTFIKWPEVSLKSGGAEALIIWV